MHRLLILAAVASRLAACATETTTSSSPISGESARGAGRLPNVFISPAGKPFRAAPGAPYPVTVWFAAADGDHDGRLTLQEFRADAEKFFHQLDTDHDGVIEGSEVAAYEQDVAPEILPNITGLRRGEGMDPSLDLGDPNNTGRRGGQEGRRSEKGPAGRPPRGSGQAAQGAALFSMLNEPEPVAAADTEFNGRITLAEFQAAADRRFAELDTGTKGYLLLSQLPKTPVQSAIDHAARRPQRGPEPATR